MDRASNSSYPVGTLNTTSKSRLGISSEALLPKRPSARQRTNLATAQVGMGNPLRITVWLPLLDTRTRTLAAGLQKHHHHADWCPQALNSPFISYAAASGTPRVDDPMDPLSSSPTALLHERTSMRVAHPGMHATSPILAASPTLAHHAVARTRTQTMYACTCVLVRSPSPIPLSHECVASSRPPLHACRLTHPRQYPWADKFLPTTIPVPAGTCMVAYSCMLLHARRSHPPSQLRPYPAGIGLCPGSESVPRFPQFSPFRTLPGRGSIAL